MLVLLGAIFLNLLILLLLDFPLVKFLLLGKLFSQLFHLFLQLFPLALELLNCSALFKVFFQFFPLFNDFTIITTPLLVVMLFVGRYELALLVFQLIDIGLYGKVLFVLFLDGVL